MAVNVQATVVTSILQNYYMAYLDMDHELYIFHRSILWHMCIYVRLPCFCMTHHFHIEHNSWRWHPFRDRNYLNIGLKRYDIPLNPNDEMGRSIPNPCKHDGHVFIHNDNFICSCPNEWTGPMCENDKDECIYWTQFVTLTSISWQELFEHWVKTLRHSFEQ
jgi:hypothetical protein